MAVKLIDDTQVQALVNSYDINLGFKYQPLGYPDWANNLMAILNLIGNTSLANLLVVPDDADNTTVRILPGRCSTSSGATVLAYNGGTVELSANNNATSLIWLYDDAGVPAIAYATAGVGWPGTAHLKLAEVTLAAGAITQIVDRRWDQMLQF